MTEPKFPPSGEAQALVNSRLLNLIFDDLERAATEAAIYAPAGDDETRWTRACEVRAIRSVRSNLAGMGAGRIKLPDDSRG